MPLIPMVIERTARGEREFDIYSQAAQRADHLPRHADRRPGRQPRRRAAAAPRERGSRQGHLALHQLARRQHLLGPGDLRHDAASSSPTSRRCASAWRCRWARCCWPAGAKGKRAALPNSRILIHQPSAGFEGQSTDIEIHAREILKLRARIDEIYAEHTGRPTEEVRADMERDRFFTAEQALEYGLVDRVLESH